MNISCQSQDDSNLSFSYKAQTRGFNLTIEVLDNHLNIKENNAIKTLKLSENQQIEINNIISTIDFENLKSDISTEDLAVDKAIIAKCTFIYHEKNYEYEFDHNNAPKSISTLTTYLQSIIE